ncbi:putative asparagine synthase [Mycena alexandri]|uniref:Asparagine synthase n=1 Tax=Mycena alexandri TaxID=1745969 RepID=A0AAD6SU27_9AGAR|nr:putative asparagine synthase [Mycena alexandri]
MCGLIAVFHPDEVVRPTASSLKYELEASIELIKHRGPDSRGIYISPDVQVGLGHARLSIIDLATGQQPMSDEEELIHCVVNGELYDHERIRAELQMQGHSFKTKSDSELVVQLYKRDGVNLLFHLRGEFAFALYDAKRRLLFVARDRFGIKPLYYTVSNGRIMFASEIKAFMGLGWQAAWDVESIAQSGEFSDDRTVFRGVKKLAPGNFVLCRSSGYMKVQAYWDLSYSAATTQPTVSVESMISTVREHLVESVRLRLRSDVPLAVYLSGGLDSSAVAGIATHLLRQNDPTARVSTFTLAYPGDQQGNDEGPVAARTAAHLGATVHMVNVDEAALVSTLEESIWHSEQPNATFHGAGKIILSRYVRSKGYKVVLTGEGSDEIFGGYGFFPSDYWRDPDPAAHGLGMALPSNEERLALLAEYTKTPGLPQISSNGIASDTGSSTELVSINTHRTLGGVFAMAAPIFNHKVWEICGPQDVPRNFAEAADPILREYSLSGRYHSLNVAMYITAKTLLSQIILNLSGDRTDMANSIESRPSFLDHHLVEYVNTLPPSLKIRPVPGEQPGQWTLTEKWILREAVKPFVTDEIYLRKKAPYNPPPASSSIAGSELMPLQAHLKARITQTSVDRLGFLDWPRIKDLLDGYLASPTFPTHGAIDRRAAALMGVLSLIVLQERFNVPPFQL